MTADPLLMTLFGTPEKPLTTEPDADWAELVEAACRPQPPMTRDQLLDLAVHLDALGLDDEAERVVTLATRASVHATLRRRAPSVRGPEAHGRTPSCRECAVTQECRPGGQT